MSKKTFYILLVVIIISVTGTYYFSRYINANYGNEFVTATTTVEEDIPKVVEIQPARTKILFIGDMMLARSIGDYIVNGSNPFSNVSSILKEYDYVIGNLETNISTDSQPIYGKLFTFNAPVQVLTCLKENNINYVSLANNHTMDYGLSGFSEMMAILKENEITYFGGGANVTEAYQPLVLENGTSTIAVYTMNQVENYYTEATEETPGSAPIDSQRTFDVISEAANYYDVVIAYPHWGYEYILEESYEEEQWGHRFVDSGADLVIGGHPHVIQPSEVYNGKTIYYSLGNFIFDLMPQEPNAGDGLAVEVIIEDGDIVEINEKPMFLTPEGFPVFK